MASTSVGCSTTSTSPWSRSGCVTIQHGSASLTMPVTEQTTSFSRNRCSADARSSVAAGGCRIRWNAIRSADRRPTPGRVCSCSSNRSYADICAIPGAYV